MSAQGVGADCVRLVAIKGLREIRPGDDLVAKLTAAIQAGNHPVAAGDVIVVTQKIVSKSEGALVVLDSVTRRRRAPRSGHGCGRKIHVSSSWCFGNRCGWCGWNAA